MLNYCGEPQLLRRASTIAALLYSYFFSLQRLIKFALYMNYPFTDTHAHLYLEGFRNDLDGVIGRAREKGVEKIFLPNLDSSSVAGMNSITEQYPGTCYAMIGLHPTSVKENYREELQRIEKELERDHYIAIGEIGIDLCWDNTFLKEQQEAFRRQIGWAKQHNLPIVIHARDSFDEIFAIMDLEHDGELTGVFHSFTGNLEQANKIDRPIALVRRI
jgi:TatD DNase family protein